MLNDLYHMLDPVAISAGPITIYWYGLAYVVGALLTAVVMYRTQRRWGFDITVDDLTSVVVGVVFGLIIGARLFYVIFYGDGYYWAHPLEIFATNEGGMSFHGGLVGGIIGGVLVCRMYKLDAWTIADLVPGALRQLCQRRAVGQADRFALGRDLRRRRGRYAAPSLPALRGIPRGHCALLHLAGAQPQKTAAAPGHVYGRVCDGLRHRPLPH